MYFFQISFKKMNTLQNLTLKMDRQPTIRMKPDKQLDCSLSQDDGVWMMASSFIIFTMTAGFGLLESGRVSSKDEVNCMVKNVFDVIFGGEFSVKPLKKFNIFFTRKFVDTNKVMAELFSYQLPTDHN